MRRILVATTIFNRQFCDIPLLVEFETLRLNLSCSGCVDLLVVDNSTITSKQDLSSYSIKFYYKSKSNLGSRELVFKCRDISFLYDGVLFLDQDSDVNGITNYIKHLFSLQFTAIYVPIVYSAHNFQLISPCRPNFMGTVTPNKSSPTSAILSGSFVPSILLIKLKYIPSVFWLDYLDHYLFITFFGNPVVLDHVFYHALSVSDIHKLPINRFLNIQIAELSFRVFSNIFSLPLGLLIFFFRLLRYTTK